MTGWGSDYSGNSKYSPKFGTVRTTEPSRYSLSLMVPCSFIRSPRFLVGFGFFNILSLVRVLTEEKTGKKHEHEKVISLNK